MHSHAVKHYSAVLSFPSPATVTADLDSMSLDPSADVDELPTPPTDHYATNDYHKVAAYNLVTLYAMKGEAELARGVAERWLAV
jgi:general transcription factor 3C polypeptide 3 (transcription factor C subunit 4)